MNKLEQVSVIGKKISELTFKTDILSIKINNTKNKRKKASLFSKLKSINKKKMFFYKLYNTMYNS